MGTGYWNTRSAVTYTSSTLGFNNMSDMSTASVQAVYRACGLNSALDPKNVIRECCDSDDHPHSLPVILGLDVTGSMGRACTMCAGKLDEIMTTLYKTNKDVEFCMMGIGDFACDNAPLQVTQFESDVRILDQTTKIYFESGGGGNGWESYTAAWYFALHNCKLDCWKRGEKGIIITMGDEPLNPYLPAEELHDVIGGEKLARNIDTDKLYKEVTEKYDVYHIAITNESSYRFYKEEIERSWRPLLGDHLIIAESNNLPDVIAAIVNSHNSTGTPIVEDNNTMTVDTTGIRW